MYNTSLEFQLKLQVASEEEKAMNEKKKNILIAWLSILSGAFSLLGIIGENKWYKIFCFTLIGLVPILAGLLHLKKSAPEALRNMSWICLVDGLFAISMAASTFYKANHLPVLNWIASIILIITGIYGLYETVHVFKLDLVP